MGKNLIPPEPEKIDEVPLRDALEERYLALVGADSDSAAETGA